MKRLIYLTLTAMLITACSKSTAETPIVQEDVQGIEVPTVSENDTHEVAYIKTLDNYVAYYTSTTETAGITDETQTPYILRIKSTCKISRNGNIYALEDSKQEYYADTTDDKLMDTAATMNYYEEQDGLKNFYVELNTSDPKHVTGALYTHMQGYPVVRTISNNDAAALQFIYDTWYIPKDFKSVSENVYEGHRDGFTFRYTFENKKLKELAVEQELTDATVKSSYTFTEETPSMNAVPKEYKDDAIPYSDVMDAYNDLISQMEVEE